ncbi:MAG: hypothetical protein FWE48_00660 [Coriobacteriia bacterium]|nr:hypothetical protein [Coriobacteriia bacterium]MCL2745594.1 hypothetical protein [Coriobacteriia bacterium]MCL2870555.1 hypothetical protein [Coriobacteriia bacterium]
MTTANQAATGQTAVSTAVKTLALNPEKIAVTPTIGDYHILGDILMERCLGYTTMPCPPMTKRTLELGAKNSPDMICTPFKITLGNQIEAAEQGANVFIMPGAGCRLGFYDILQRQVLKDLGFKVELISLFDYVPTAKRLFQTLSSINPDLTQEHFDRVFATVVQITLEMDKLADFMRRNRAFEITKGDFQRAYQDYLQEVIDASCADAAADVGIKYDKILKAIPLDKPRRPIRIGILGEIYVVVEPFSNCHMEDWLTEHKVEIDRPFDLTRMAMAINSVPELIEKSGGYVDYNLGSTANEVIAQAHSMMQDGIDGIIHVKPASCSPEITAMTILQNMSRDFGVPVMYLTFDTETGEAGVHTRLEAFLDMITMKRQDDSVSEVVNQAVAEGNQAGINQKKGEGY